MAIEKLLEKLSEREIREKELHSNRIVIDFLKGKIQTLVVGIFLRTALRGNK